MLSADPCLRRRHRPLRADHPAPRKDTRRHRVSYIFGLSTNASLAAQIEVKADEVRTRRVIGNLDVVRDYAETLYAARSWSRSRRVVARIEATRRGSWMLGSHPSLLVNSDWSRDSIGGYLGTDDTRYLDQPRQSRTNWTASMGGTLAMGRDQLTLAVAHLGLHQDRTERDALPTDTPVAY